MTRTYNHKKGDNFLRYKNRSGSSRYPRKEWREGLLFNKRAKKNDIKFELKVL